MDGSPSTGSVHIELDSQNELSKIWTWLFNMATFLLFGLVQAGTSQYKCVKVFCMFPDDAFGSLTKGSLRSVHCW
jgi:hypothetical protein